jgi:hypothetical protein
VKAVAVVAVIVAAGLLLAAPCTLAATVEDSATEGPNSEDFLLFQAGPGERNRLTISDSRKGIVLVDHGARMRNSGGGFGACKFSRDRHRALCELSAETDHFVVELGDRDDVVRFKGTNGSRHGLTARTTVSDAMRFAEYYDELDGAIYDHAELYGGAGNDVLRGTNRQDLLDGGRGRDVVDGGNGPDRILDTPDGVRDRLFGGRGIDMVDGNGGRPLNIDLNSRVLVAGNEVDNLNSMEKARGGSGDDMLAGTNGPDALFGDLGSDELNGRRGDDYLGGDLEAPQSGSRGEPGQDVLVGGEGRDVLDGRDGSLTSTLTPTDQLSCGDGTDRIIALQDDLADPSCESSLSGRFTGDLYFSQFVDAAPPLSDVSPVARGADGAPTYAIGCRAVFGERFQCSGRVQLERPPVTGTEPEVLGSGAYTIPEREKRNVPVVLNAAGRAVIATPGARVSVHVIEDSPVQEFGWQQVLGR